MAFHGETVSDTVAAILKQEPDWTALPKETPVRIRELIRRSLEKDPRQRLRDIGDARLVLTEAARSEASATETRRAGTSRRTMLAIATVGLVMAIAAAWTLSRDLLRPKSMVRRLSIVVPDDLTMVQSEITPDGRKTVAIGFPGGPSGNEPQRIYVRDMAQTSFEAIPGTERARFVTITPDSRSALYVARVSASSQEFQLYRVPLDGSAPPIKVADWDSDWGFGGYGITCISGSEILSSAQQGNAYVRVFLDGRPPSKPIRFNAKGYQGQFYTLGPTLPGGRAVWVEGISYERMGFHRDIGLLEVASGEIRILVRDAGCPHYARTGHLLYTRGGVLMSAPFDRRARKLGNEMPVARDLRCPSPIDNAQFDLSDDGTLQTVPGGSGSDARKTVIIDDRRHVSDWSQEAMGRARNAPRPSPDGRRIAWVNPNPRLIDEIWLSERGGLASRRLVAVPGADCFSPVWSPDGRRLVYAQIGNTDKDGLYIIEIEGGATTRIAAFSKTVQMGPTSWSEDQILALRYRGDSGDILKFDTSPDPGALPEGTLIFQDATNARFSPDGRAVAYVSASPGRIGYVCITAWGNGSPVGEQVPIGKGSNPIWSPDGSKILYREEPGSKLMVAKIGMVPHATVSPPISLLDLDSLRVVGGLYDILPDGRLVAVQKALAESEIRRFDITLNFFEDLRSRMDGRGAQP